MNARDAEGNALELVTATITPVVSSSATALAAEPSGGTIAGTLTPLAAVPPDYLGGIVDNAGGPPLCEPPDVEPPALRMSGIRYQWEVTNDAGDAVGIVLYGELPGLATGEGFSVGDTIYAFLIAETAGRASGACQIADQWDDPEAPPTYDNGNGWIEYDLELVAGWNRLVGTVLETMNEGGDVARLRLEVGDHVTDRWNWFRGGSLLRLNLAPDGATYTVRSTMDGSIRASGGGGLRELALAPGAYTVEASLEGYEPFETVEPIVLGSGDVVDLPITLEPIPAN